MNASHHSSKLFARHRLAVLAVVLALSACGGGGGAGYGNVAGAALDPTVTRMTINSIDADPKALTISVEGALLDQGFELAAPACSALTLLSTAPLASGASTAYYRCTTTAPAPAVVQVDGMRSRDRAVLGSATFTLGAQPLVVGALAGAGAAAGTPGTAKYGQTMTVTVTGTNVNQGLSLSSPACSGMKLSVSPPLVSTSSTAYYQCRVSAIDLNQVSVALASAPQAALVSPQFAVPLPQVTMTISRDKTQLGQLVLTLAPIETPVTTDNFLDYVNAGYYDGTVFHRTIIQPAPFIVQGGGYTSVGTGLERPKETRLAIPLEVNRGLSNTRWTIAMARSSAPDSATAQFFINLADNLFLDPHPPTSGDPGIGYAVFGTVTAGIDVVNAIASSACQQITGFSECAPIPNVIVDSAVQTQ